MSASPRLEVIVPTFQRTDLLRLCLESFVASDPVENLAWHVTVVDNASDDDTPNVVKSFTDRHPDRFSYLYEAKRGRSAAINAGIRATTSDLVGLIDDDERVTAPWLGVVERTFRSDAIHYAGGPCLGSWVAAKPEWCPPPGYEGVLSVDDSSTLPDGPVPFDADERLFLRGGNSVFRRSVFDAIGLLAEDLGRLHVGLGSCEDEDIFRRLRRSGQHGVFDPALAIWHHVPPARLTRSYHRRWARDQARSLARLERRYPPAAARLGRVPRWRVGATVRGLLHLFNANPAERFAAELRCWTLLGYVEGAYRT